MSAVCGLCACGVWHWGWGLEVGSGGGVGSGEGIGVGGKVDLTVADGDGSRQLWAFRVSVQGFSADTGIGGIPEIVVFVCVWL